MDEDSKIQSRQKIVIIGAGPVGSLAALYAAQRGHDVEVYELRSAPDLRDPCTTPLNFTKSINLALSERGINALKHSQRPQLVDKILDETIPMRARMIHGRRKSGSLYEESQDYDIHGKKIFAVDRSTLNSRLLDELDIFPNVQLFFKHKLVGLDLDSRKVKLEYAPDSATDISDEGNKPREFEVDFDLIIGADGAHSAVRQHMMKYLRMDYAQSYVDTLWCEFTIQPKYLPSNDQNSRPEFQISPEHLHIWPGKEYMFIAIPSNSRKFICTLFAPSYVFEKLSQSPQDLLEFFYQNFPGVAPELIPPASLIESFSRNPHLPLISIQCSPHHVRDCAVILGDATHAMVPFYGQGMNAGFEDVRVLFQTLDMYSTSSHPSQDRRALALEQFSALRVEDSQAISRLSLENYMEMRSSVTSRLYKCRKLLEEKLNFWFPSLGWATKYSRVSFGNMRYSEVCKRSDYQGAIISYIFQGIGMVALSGALWIALKLRRAYVK
ncbi:Kynurenine 3-monooxygenase [Golovinomyces cichoracearum]|uniref:Kynurenine 3-monooxygenase n=1 Tax=Golovinomyces cichoracearum TaxID=62708 RepID=A0A420J6N4_9PEZI|nr:Kynurenine 3-monooxygenase [Golovinomyces cichoracearum]